MYNNNYFYKILFYSNGTFIWANHNMKSYITLMEKLSKDIYDNESLKNVERNIATIKDIFT